jgi:hypothetical protein
MLLATLAVGAIPAAAAVESHAPEGILQLFEAADVVLLGERAWSKLDGELRNSIARHPDFTRTVDDVVIEFANARYQDMLDAYVLEMQPVPIEELNKIWRDTMRPGVWESPVYQEFIEIVRRVNRRTLPEHRVRIVAGDPPIEWAKVYRWGDTAPYRDRHGYAVEVIGTEVLEKKRKALVIYAAQDLPRGIKDRRGNLTTRLEGTYPNANVFVIATVPDQSAATAEVEKSIEFKKRPTLVKLGRSSMGMWPAATLFEGATGSLKQMADGLIYMGNLRDRPAPPAADAVRDTGYVRELRRRHSIVGR